MDEQARATHQANVTKEAGTATFIELPCACICKHNIGIVSSWQGLSEAQ
jgi:hypothetical protein